MSGPSILQVATEWLAICAIVTEETLRPRRIIDVELGVSQMLSPETTSTGKSLKDLLAQSPWECIAPHLSDFSSTISGALHDDVQELLHAHTHPPPKPKPSSHSPTPVTEYLEWRVSLSGLRVLAELFLSLDKHPEYRRVLAVALEIITCVTDLFAYNIHQAWHSQSNNNKNHLNILSYLLSADPTLTLQGGVNIIGGMIRDRTAQLKDELETLKHQPQSPLNKTSGVLASILSPFFTGTQDAVPSNSNGGDTEIQRTLVNWVTGTIHWAYEVEYFFPKLEDEQGPGSRRRRGGEIRDYGWIFLIKTGGDLNE
ncbi:hypothetical protein P691DRAFT_791235 [Macrolepiota fuliginosa MF-IS2]|uniref:Uncharacterized protein n=1 Tax=Macrolepiota fuliginosa MF-IS2 TaxID=1400762 RepID=A0A9P6C521_9AGAR|nr:hypothetical protein P691DRAFT_791235 [Macrolepiota fuliginosa MF-IS2]